MLTAPHAPHINPLAFEATVQSVYQDFQPKRGIGEVASYIPALAKVDPSRFGICAQLVHGKPMGHGDYDSPFSIQSISKLFAFTMAFAGRGDLVWKRVGNEPSGTSFNSLVQLESEEGIPRNPFINAGAMVLCDLLLDDYDDPTAEMLAFLSRLTGDESVSFDEEVFHSELAFGARNAALAYLMKSFGNIHHPVEQVIRTYFQQCSITMTCQQLAQATQFLANQGVNPLTNRAVLSPSQTKRTNAILLTTGLYNEAGDFAYRVGIPAKSGVGGGIVAIIPGALSIATWAPGLNKIGNSLLGIDFLEEFTTRTGLSIF